MLALYLKISLGILDELGVEYSDNSFHEVVKCNKDLEEYIIKSSAEKIVDGTENENAFGQDCANLKHVRFKSDSNLTKIGNYAFYKSKIINIDFSNCSKLESIGEHTFYSCSNLNSITFNDNINYIGQRGFCFTSPIKKSYFASEFKIAFILGIWT